MIKILKLSFVKTKKGFRYFTMRIGKRHVAFASDLLFLTVIVALPTLLPANYYGNGSAY